MVSRIELIDFFFQLVFHFFFIRTLLMFDTWRRLENDRRKDRFFKEKIQT